MFTANCLSLPWLFASPEWYDKGNVVKWLPSLWIPWVSDPEPRLLGLFPRSLRFLFVLDKTTHFLHNFLNNFKRGFELHIYFETYKHLITVEHKNSNTWILGETILIQIQFMITAISCFLWFHWTFLRKWHIRFLKFKVQWIDFHCACTYLPWYIITYKLLYSEIKNDFNKRD